MLRRADPMEVGSITKALTGLPITDSVERGAEPGRPIDTHLSQLLGAAVAGQAAAAADMTNPEIMRARPFGPLGVTDRTDLGIELLARRR